MSTSPKMPSDYSDVEKNMVFMFIRMILPILEK
jgi:hypothetical protein